MSVDIQCVAHLHGGPANGTTIPLAWAKLEIHMPVWGQGIEDSTTALYRLRGPYLLQPVAHYDHVPAPVTVKRRPRRLFGWFR